MAECKSVSVVNSNVNKLLDRLTFENLHDGTPTSINVNDTEYMLADDEALKLIHNFAENRKSVTSLLTGYCDIQPQDDQLSKIMEQPFLKEVFEYHIGESGRPLSLKGFVKKQKLSSDHLANLIKIGEFVDMQVSGQYFTHFERSRYYDALKMAWEYNVLDKCVSTFSSFISQMIEYEVPGTDDTKGSRQMNLDDITTMLNVHIIIQDYQNELAKLYSDNQIAKLPNFLLRDILKVEEHIMNGNIRVMQETKAVGWGLIASYDSEHNVLALSEEMNSPIFKYDEFGGTSADVIFHELIHAGQDANKRNLIKKVREAEAYMAQRFYRAMKRGLESPIKETTLKNILTYHRYPKLEETLIVHLGVDPMKILDNQENFKRIAYQMALFIHASLKNNKNIDVDLSPVEKSYTIMEGAIELLKYLKPNYRLIYQMTTGFNAGKELKYPALRDNASEMDGKYRSMKRKQYELPSEKAELARAAKSHSDYLKKHSHPDEFESLRTYKNYLYFLEGSLLANLIVRNATDQSFDAMKYIREEMIPIFGIRKGYESFDSSWSGVE